MQPGAHRYARSLGFVGGLGETAAERERTGFEKALGVDFTGSFVPAGGSGITVGVAPTTILLGLLGAGVGYSMKKNLGGALMGGIAAFVLVAGVRGVSALGI